MRRKIQGDGSQSLIVHLVTFSWVQTALQNFGFAPEFSSLESVLMIHVGVISLHVEFISGLTKVLLKGFIWERSIAEANRAPESLCHIHTHT